MAEKKQKKQCAASLGPDAPVPHKLCEMLWTVGPAFARWTESRVCRLGKSPQRMRLMACLYENGPMKMGDLRTEMGVTATSITALTDSLEKEGMVTRNAHKTDRRVTIIKLTAAAERQLEAQCTPFKNSVSGIFEDFSREEQKGFLKLLTRLRDALSEQEQKCGAE